MTDTSTTKLYVLIILSFYFVIVALLYVGYGNYVYNTQNTFEDSNTNIFETGIGTIDSGLEKLGFLGYFRTALTELPVWLNLLFLGIPFGIGMYIFISMFFGGGGG